MSFVFFAGRSTVLSKLGDNFKVVSFFVESGNRDSILKHDHGWGLGGTIPEFGEFRVILLLDTDQSASVLQKSLCPENVILDVLFRVCIVEVNKHGHILRELGDNFIHSLVLGLQGGGRTHKGGGGRRGSKGLDAVDGTHQGQKNGDGTSLHDGNRSEQ